MTETKTCPLPECGVVFSRPEGCSVGGWKSKIYCCKKHMWQAKNARKREEERAPRPKRRHTGSERGSIVCPPDDWLLVSPRAIRALACATERELALCEPLVRVQMMRLGLR